MPNETLKSFRLTWDGSQYRVSIPNYDGGSVYKAEDVDAVIESAQNVADWWHVQWNDKEASLFGFQQHIGDTEEFQMFNALAALLPPKETPNAQ